MIYDTNVSFDYYGNSNIIDHLVFAVVDIYSNLSEFNQIIIVLFFILYWFPRLKISLFLFQISKEKLLLGRVVRVNEWEMERMRRLWWETKWALAEPSEPKLKALTASFPDRTERSLPWVNNANSPGCESNKRASASPQ